MWLAPIDIMKPPLATNSSITTTTGVIADHDWWRCPKKECRAKWDYESKRCPSCGSSGVTEPVGEKYAKQTGLPYWMPPEPGTDANDYHQAHGVEALADALREVLNAHK